MTHAVRDITRPAKMVIGQDPDDQPMSVIGVDMGPDEKDFYLYGELPTGRDTVVLRYTRRLVHWTPKGHRLLDGELTFNNWWLTNVDYGKGLEAPWFV